MMASILLRRLLTLCVAALAITAPVRAAPVTVFAAASLTDVLRDAGTRFTTQTRVPVRFSFASSAVVARQIEAGAKADLFVSADVIWMDYLVARQAVLPASRRTLAGGRLALVAAADRARPVRIAAGFPLARMLRGGRLAIGDPASVPAGRYGEAALRQLGVWPAVQGHLARADNVRAALAFVSRGEAPYGIVYETDARIDPRVRIVGLFPATSHPPILYPAAFTPSAGPDAARFLAWLAGPAGRTLFLHYGFQVGGR